MSLMKKAMKKKKEEHPLHRRPKVASSYNSLSSLFRDKGGLLLAMNVKRITRFDSQLFQL